MPSFWQLNTGDYRWDYRHFLPAIIEAITARLGHILALEPLFRTTGYFRNDLAEMREQLTAFANNMVNCLQWTRDYDTSKDITLLLWLMAGRLERWISVLARLPTIYGGTTEYSMTTRGSQDRVTIPSSRPLCTTLQIVCRGQPSSVRSIGLRSLARAGFLICSA